MIKTFTDLNGTEWEILAEGLSSVDYKEDIVTGNITGYIANMANVQVEIDKENYNALKNYLDTLAKEEIEKNCLEYSSI